MTKDEDTIAKLTQGVNQQAFTMGVLVAMLYEKQVLNEKEVGLLMGLPDTGVSPWAKEILHEAQSFVVEAQDAAS